MLVRVVVALAMTASLFLVGGSPVGAEAPKVPVLKYNPAPPRRPGTKIHGHVRNLPKLPKGTSGMGSLRECTTPSVSTVQEMEDHCTVSIRSAKFYRGTGFSLTIESQRSIRDPASNTFVDCATTTCSIAALAEGETNIVLSMPFQTLPQ